MAGDNDKFLLDISKFVTKSEKTIHDTRKFICYELFSRVIDRTSIGFTFEPHSGTAKYNWKCTLNNLSSSVLKGTDKKGTTTKNRMSKVLDRATGDDDIYFSNSVPYILALEDGLYVKNPVKGSYNRQTGKYEIRSSGGFSKLSPQGMVKVSILAFSSISKNSIRKAKATN